MDGQFFDDLAKGLSDGHVSRRRALKLVGAALLATTVPSLFPKPAYASARKRCRRKGGSYLSKGNCHCAWKCGADAQQFTCGGNPNCTCFKDASGRGVCGIPRPHYHQSLHE